MQNRKLGQGMFHQIVIKEILPADALSIVQISGPVCIFYALLEPQNKIASNHTTEQQQCCPDINKLDD